MLGTEMDPESSKNHRGHPATDYLVAGALIAVAAAGLLRTLGDNVHRVQDGSSGRLAGQATSSGAPATAAQPGDTSSLSGVPGGVQSNPAGQSR